MLRNEKNQMADRKVIVLDGSRAEMRTSTFLAILVDELRHAALRFRLTTAGGQAGPLHGCFGCWIETPGSACRSMRMKLSRQLSEVR